MTPTMTSPPPHRSSRDRPPIPALSATVDGRKALLTRWDSLPADIDVREATHQIVKDLIHRLRHHVDSLKSDDDVESVHQIRVFCRRAQSAISAFDEVPPVRKKGKLKRLLHTLRQSAGHVRDLDVMDHLLSQMGDQHHPPEERDALKTFLSNLQHARQKARQQLDRLLAKWNRKGRWDWIDRQLKKVLRRHSRTPADDKLTFRQIAKNKLEKELQRFLDLGIDDHDNDVEKLHDVRLAAKRFRYTVEVFGCFIDRATREQLYAPIKQLQDRLGSINDMTNLAQTLGEAAGHTNNPVHQAGFLALADRCRARSDQAIADFNNSWSQDIRSAYRLRFVHWMQTQLSSDDASTQADDVEATPLATNPPSH
jgi:CHAD domain-containing protein